MNTSLPDRLRTYITPEDAGYLALLLDEPPAAIEQAWEVIAPLLLQVAHHQTRTPGDAEMLYKWTEDYADATDFPEAGVFVHNDAFPDWIAQNTTLAGRFFGSGVLELMDRIGRWAGLRPDSVGVLMTAAIPGFLGDLGRTARAEGIEPATFKPWLSQQQMEAIPDDLLLNDLLTPAEVPEDSNDPERPEPVAPMPVADTSPDTTDRIGEEPAVKPRKKLIGSAMGILAIVVLALLAFLLWQQFQ